MSTHSKKKLAIFLIIGVILIIISILPNVNNSRGQSLLGAGDESPPTTTIEYASPLVEMGGERWINTNTTVYVNATDESGVDWTHYEIWKDADGDDVFETLEKNITVYDNDPNDDDTSPDISISFTISSSCYHRIKAYSTDKVGNSEFGTELPLREEWNYSYQHVVTHCWEEYSYYADKYKLMVFGSSPAIADLFNSTPDLEIVCGSDEVNNYYPELGYAYKGGIWRCWLSNGSILWARPTETDEARSSPAICDINGDGTPEIAAGTTSGWNVEVMENDGSFMWMFPSHGETGGSFCWHSSPALVDIVDDNPNLEGLELVIGNNPYHNVWCFDGDNSDGVDDGIHLPRSFDGSSPYFPWKYGDLGVEGTDWDVLWVFDNGEPIIASPAVDDVDDDGSKEVVVGSLDGNLYVLNGANGHVEWNYTTGAAVYSSAALANIDDDPQLEILVGSNDTYLYCLDGKTGNMQWRFKTDGAVYSSPAIGDVDGDSLPEIVFGSLDGSIYCLNVTGAMEWKYYTGGAVYSSPALSDTTSLYSSEWPMFRHDCARTGFYSKSDLGKSLYIFIGSDDGYLYKLYGQNGSLLSRFLTNGPIHTSPVVGDIDGDGAVEVMFYDWGEEWGGNDTFWCLEEPTMIKWSYVHVDNTPPVTTKDIDGEGDGVYTVTDETPIWLNGTDSGNCSVGIRYLHYEIWWDSDGNGFVDTIVSNETIWDNSAGDSNPADGIISARFMMTHYGINQIRWYSTDMVANKESTHYQTHLVIVTAPDLVVRKHDNPDPVESGGILSYSINVTNEGNEDATNVRVIDDYDETRISIVSDDGGYDNGHTIIWHITKLSPGDYVEYDITARVKYDVENGTILHNIANVTCDEGSTDEADEPTTVISSPFIEIEKKAEDVNGAPLKPGDTVHYTIYLNNTGNMDQGNNAGNEFEDFIPSHTSYADSLTSSSGTASYISSSKKIIWNGNIDVNETVTIEFDVTVSSPLDNGTLISNCGTVYWDSNGDGTNNAETLACANLTVTSSPILTIEKTDSSDPVQADGELVYYLWINNTGDANATNVVVTESYDPNTQFLNSIPSPSSGNTIWQFSKIVAGGSKTIEIHVHVLPVENGTILHNIANVTCDEGSTDEADELTEVRSLPALEIEKVSIPDVAEAGGSIEYRIWVNNTGTAPATNVVVKDLYDSNISFNHSYPVPDDISHSVWTFPVVDVGIPVVITIFVDISPSFEGDIIYNFVNVTCDEGIYDQAWANTTIEPAPPITVKKFHGFVYNITLFQEEGGYLLHYIPNETLITLVATDMPEGGASGVNHTYYRIFKWNYSSGRWDILFNWEEYGVWNAYPPFYPIDLSSLGIEYGYEPCGKYEIEFYSIDRAGNIEGMEWNDIIVDCDIPQSHVMPLSNQIYNDTFEVEVNATDNGDVKEVTLYYRYSSDNSTWGDWYSYGTLTDDYRWTFVPPHGGGYYQFYSVAEDYVGHKEDLPDAATIPDAFCEVVSSPWDINGDGSVDIFDIVIVTQHWMETPSDPNWCECADINGDEIVDMDDILMIADHWTG